MDIKYTIEILTKDIQDIENLVSKLQNSKEASAIELDLAMSKLRNVYEILTMIKADRLNELVDASFNESETVPESSPETETVDEEKPESRPKAKAEPETVVEKIPESRPEAKAEPETLSEPNPVPEPEPDTSDDTSDDPGPGTNTETQASEGEDKHILAEKFSAESSINENLAGSRGEQLDTKLIGQPIDNIARNIGINDRFLIIRELFEGNSEGFSKLIASLDGAESYQNATGLLEEQFADSMDHEGVEILSGLVKRRYLR